MKILFISDIHSNFPALEAVWKKEHDSDYILCAGDLVDWGFHPKEVLDWCREHRVICVSGNHDKALCEAYHAQEAGTPPPAGSFLAHNISRLSREDILWLDNLKEVEIFQNDTFAVYIKHFYADEEENRKALFERWARDEALMAFDEEWPASVTAKTRILYTGHSHQSWIYQADHGTYFLNPGSVSYRGNSDSRAKGAFYAVWENGHLDLRHAEYENKIFIPLLENEKLGENEKAIAGYHLVRELPI